MKFYKIMNGIGLLLPLSFKALAIEKEAFNPQSYLNTNTVKPVVYTTTYGNIQKFSSPQEWITSLNDFLLQRKPQDKYDYPFYERLCHKQSISNWRGCYMALPASATSLGSLFYVLGASHPAIIGTFFVGGLILGDYIYNFEAGVDSPQELFKENLLSCLHNNGFLRSNWRFPVKGAKRLVRDYIQSLSSSPICHART